MNLKNQRLCLWVGYSFLLFYLLGFVGIAHFIPPPSPSWSPAELANFFNTNRTTILLGMLVCAIASPLIVPWTVVLFLQMQRIESKYTALSYTQLINGALIAPFFMIPPLVWAALAYRADQDPLTLRTLNDFAWIAWIVSWPFVFFQEMALGLCGISDTSSQPIIPRWMCFLSFWAAGSMVPAGAVIFVKSGPFAWNGLFGIYLPLCVYVVWYTSITVALSKAIRRQSLSPGQDLIATSLEHPLLSRS